MCENRNVSLFQSFSPYEESVKSDIISSLHKLQLLFLREVFARKNFWNTPVEIDVQSFVPVNQIYHRTSSFSNYRTNVNVNENTQHAQTLLFGSFSACVTCTYVATVTNVYSDTCPDAPKDSCMTPCSWHHGNHYINPSLNKVKVC